MLQCNGHGGCHAWEATSQVNPTAFCKCDSAWADPKCRTRRKSQSVAFLLALFLGIVGADRFYLGLTISGSLKFFTLGALSVYWITELLITRSSPMNLSKDLSTWGGLLKVISIFGLTSWYFVDVVRTGSGPVETSAFRTAPDLPREALCFCALMQLPGLCGLHGPGS